MKVSARLERLRRAVGGLPPPGQLGLVVAVPIGSGMAADVPPVVHLNADGRVATVVFEGMGPDPQVLIGLGGKLAPAGLMVTTNP